MKKVIPVVLMVLVFSINLPAQNGWYQQTNPLGDNMVGKIQFVSQNEGWIVAGSRLLHTTNAGEIWSPVNLNDSDSIMLWSDPAVNMSFINPSTGWVLGTKISNGQWDGARIFKTTNGGNTWASILSSSWDAGIYLQFVDANNGWILLFETGFTSGGIFRTTNGGGNWTALTSVPVGGFPYFINSMTGWLLPTGPDATPTADTIRKTTNGGLTWFAPWGTSNQVNLSSIHFSDINNGWISGRNGVALKTTNGGQSWSYITNLGVGSNARSKSVFFINANTGWIAWKIDAVMNQVFVLHTKNGGSSWETQPLPFNESIFSIHFFDALNGGLTGDGGKIYHTFTGGVNVKNISSEVPVEFSLSQNYPNPFNPVTTIRFDIPKKDDPVLIKVYDLLGREVNTLVNESLLPGTYEVRFDASALTSGVYLYTMTSGNFTDTKKMLLLK